MHLFRNHLLYQHLSRCPFQQLSKRLYLVVTLLISLLLVGASSSALSANKGIKEEARRVIFVGNNWEGMIDVIDAETYAKLGRINGVPDKRERMREIIFNPIKLLAFQAIRHFIGEGHDQLVDDMYSTRDGRLLIVSRPSFADVVGIDIATNEIAWRFAVKGIRSDHMALSPDGTQVAVSASTGKVVHILDVETGEELGQFPSGDSPHENVYSKDGSKIYHASIGMVFTPLDEYFLDFTKGKRTFQVVDTRSLKIIKQFNMADKLKEAGLHGLSPAIRPMAHSPDERFFYFQLSFLHGFVEYDMQEDIITRMAQLPNLVPAMPINQYVNDSAHHGIAMNSAGDTLCVAGTMDDYVALVNRNTFEYQLLTGLGKKPYWVTSDQAGENCYISWSETDQMSVINYKTGEEVVRIDVGDHPQRIREGYVPIDWKVLFL
ncbi:YncE family protein [Spartinivicinus poritis]|uniref:YncE family protein n=1 Tax=Spartinivicinus poritis TaxID=2994640 RepID=A0ABT5UD78_9GAMM|nr:YncE family protein [Spartinivicinus sp. A2-2]MDE1464335.1 YncE family protein [Spartinivicinus sp. A2-2]